MPLILGTNSIKDTGFNVSNSLRLDEPSNQGLTITPGSAGNRKTFTISIWVKRAKITNQTGDVQTIFESRASGSDNCAITFEVDDTLQIKLKIGGSNAKLITNRLFRDVSAWMHIVVAIDTTQGTASNRNKLYINGVQETSFGTEDYPSQDAQTSFNNSVGHGIGKRSDVTTQNFDGYIAEAVMIDGSALAPTNFGEFDEDSPTIWKPKDVTGLTFGTNGLYLQFKESGTSQNSSGLGADTSGNGNHFAVNNLTAVAQSTDTCTNNFATMNPLDNYYASSTFAEGNLKITTNASNQTFNTGTIGLSTGKWYFEAKLVQAGGEESIGITDIVSTGTGIYGGKTANSYSFKGNNGDIRNNDSNSSYGSAYAQDSIVSVFIDLDNNKLYFAIDGTLQNSGTGHSITAPASTTNGVYFPMVGDVDTDSVIWECNFGSPSFAISSGNTDGEYGNFEYSTTITGDGASKTFKAINTKNLAEFG
jgi:hypothetical protein